jgi:hypothetical protein
MHQKCPTILLVDKNKDSFGYYDVERLSAVIDKNRAE